MDSDFEELYKKYKFNSIKFFPNEIDLFDWIHDIKGQNLLVLDYHSKDFRILLNIISSAKKSPILAIQNIYTVGEWGSILLKLKEIGQNFFISQAGEYGVVEWDN